MVPPDRGRVVPGPGPACGAGAAACCRLTRGQRRYPGSRTVHRVTQPETPSSPEGAPRQRPVLYKGDPLDAEKGPGLGCFRFQLVALAVLLVLTPLSVAWRWPFAVSAVLLFAVLILLLVTGQTIIFLLRLVAADRRAAGRRRPMGSATKTVGELEDEARPPAETPDA